MEELTYYLVESPLREGKIAVTDKYSLSQILENREKIELKKMLRIPEEDRGKTYDSGREEEVAKAENYLHEMYKEEAGNLLGSAVFSIGTGIGLTYLFFKPLFDAGAYALPRYRIENAYKMPVEELPSHIVNNPQMVDWGGRFFSKIAGSTMGSLPFLAGLYYGAKYFLGYRKYKRFSERIGEMEAIELELVPDKSLSSFKKESEEVINETRKYAQEFLSTESRKKKLKICIKMEGGLRRMSCLSKTYGLEGVSKYYLGLEDGFSELKGMLKKPRFWKNEKKCIKKLFGGEV